MATRVNVFSGRLPAASLTAAVKPTRLVRQCRVLASASSEVPPNVAEARAWIAAWKAKQQAAPAAAPAPVEVPKAGSNGKPSRRKKTAGKAAAEAAPEAEAALTPAVTPAPVNKLAATALKDGTLVFTADQLKSVDYTDVLRK